MEAHNVRGNAALTLDEAACWQAVLQRDETQDGAFVYGVCSTHIFCRPSCPSRRPKLDGTRFFGSTQDACKAGFRACKRCRPDEFHSRQMQRVREACRLIEANGETPLSLEALGQHVGGSPFHLQRTFKQVTCITPREYADAVRLRLLKEKLQEGASVTHALYDAGYGSARGLYEKAPSQLGMTPATYGRGGSGMHITTGIVPCSLGFLLVAATPKGICSVTLGDTEDELEAALRREFPAAAVQRDDTRMQATMQTLLALLAGEEPHEHLPLDVRATAFQWKVWQHLRTIGTGETQSYIKVAVAIGQPQAARAVARACATNPVALVIPCHRVVRGNGVMAGYRWGLERKEALLNSEIEGTARRVTKFR